MARRGHTTKAEATRALLIDAALKVIGRKGYAGASVDEIVREAGVSKGVAYYHFRNKAAIAASVLERGLGQIIDGFEQAAKTAPTAAASLNAMINQFASMVFENEEFGRFFVTELWRNDRDWSEAMRSHETRLMKVLGSQLDRGKEEGLFRQDLNTGFVAVSLVGMVLTTALFYTGAGAAPDARPLPMPDVDFPLLGKEEFVAAVVDFVRRACAA